MNWDQPEVRGSRTRTNAVPFRTKPAGGNIQLM